MHVTVVCVLFCWVGVFIFLAECIDHSIFAKGNSEKILFLQAGQIVSICSSYFLWIAFHDLHVHLLNKTSSSKTICSNPAAFFCYLAGLQLACLLLKAEVSKL